GRRLDNPQPAGDVQIDVVGGDRQPATRIQHRGDHRQPGSIPPHDGSARRPEECRGKQSLNLDEHRPRALDAGEYSRAADWPDAYLDFAVILARAGRCRTSAEKQGRGVRDLDEAAIAHLEDTDLVGSAKAVFYRAQNAELVPALALEIEHGVDHVL